MQTILTYNRWILGLMILLSLTMAPGMTKIHVSHKMDEYFSHSGEDLKIYNTYRSIFGDDDEFILVAIESDSVIFNRNFIRQLDSVKENLAAIPGIEKVLWIDDWLPRYVKLDEDLIAAIPEGNIFISNDYHAVALYLKHTTIEQKEDILPLVKGIQDNLAPFPLSKAKIAGKIYFTVLLEEFMRRDSGWLFLVTLILTVVILWLILGSGRLLLISLVVPLLAISFTLGLMGNLGLHYNLFTTMIPTLILIISVSDIIHIVKGAGPTEKKQRVLYHFAALLLTSVTTAIGFGSLITTEIQAITEFGAFVALGVMYTFLLTIVIFSMVPFEKYQQETFVDRLLDIWVKIIQKFYQKPVVILLVFLGFILLIMGGIYQVKSNAYLISGVPENSEIRQNSQYFAEHFSGTRPLSIFVQKKQADAEIPEGIFPELDSLIRLYFKPSFLAGPDVNPRFDTKNIKVASEDRQSFRFYGLIPDEGTLIASQKHDSLTQAIQANPRFEQLTIHYTGISRMIDKNTADTTRSIMIGLFTALGITFVLLTIYFKRVGEAFISLIVNIIPLLVLAAVYGYWGIELRAGTSVAFSIAFGIAIDDTMHILATYKKQKALGHSFDQVLIHSGRPVLMTTLVFGISFSALIFSGLEGISILGLSMVVGCSSALIVDLILLPAFLSILNRYV
ncbi:MAG: MMPL family transporter [Bacteroidetes bacterium]|nr:MMPL family transporter [Bacteroidota bacterium]